MTIQKKQLSYLQDKITDYRSIIIDKCKELEVLKKELEQNKQLEAVHPLKSISPKIKKFAQHNFDMVITSLTTSPKGQDVELEKILADEKMKTPVERRIEVCINEIEETTLALKKVESDHLSLLLQHESTRKGAKKMMIREVDEFLAHLINNSVLNKADKSTLTELRKNFKTISHENRTYIEARKVIGSLIKDLSNTISCKTKLEEITALWKGDSSDPDSILSEIANYQKRENKKTYDDIQMCIETLEKHWQKNPNQFEKLKNSMELILQKMRSEQEKYSPTTENVESPSKDALDDWHEAIDNLKSPNIGYAGLFNKQTKPQKIIAEFNKIVEKAEKRLATAIKEEAQDKTPENAATGAASENRSFF